MKTILLVEDDASLRELVSVLLRIEGYEVQEAENGKEALDWLQKMQSLPCLVLLDLMMPIMSGSEMLRELQHHARFSALPVIILSANEYSADAAAGVTFLRKPVDPRVLSSAVRERCGPP